MAGKMLLDYSTIPPVAVSTLVATVTTVFPVAGGSNNTHTWSSPPSFTFAKKEGSNVAKSVNHKIISTVYIDMIIMAWPTYCQILDGYNIISFFYLIQQHK